MLKKLKITPLDNFVKNCIHEHIDIRANGEIVREIWGFYAENFPCGMCHKTDEILFIRVSPPLNMVAKTCKYCGITEPVPVRNPIDNAEIGSLIKTEAITVEEAYEFIKKYKIDKVKLIERFEKVVESYAGSEDDFRYHFNIVLKRHFS